MISEQGPRNIIDVHSHFFAPELWQGVERILGPSSGVAAFDKVKESKNHMQRFNAQQRVELIDDWGNRPRFRASDLSPPAHRFPSHIRRMLPDDEVCVVGDGLEQKQASAEVAVADPQLPWLH